jgi:hypothetical protein
MFGKERTSTVVNRPAIHRRAFRATMIALILVVAFAATTTATSWFKVSGQVGGVGGGHTICFTGGTVRAIVPTVTSSTGKAQVVGVYHVLEKKVAGVWHTGPTQSRVFRTDTQAGGYDDFTLTSKGTYRVLTLVIWPNNAYAQGVINHYITYTTPSATSYPLHGPYQSCTY